MFIGSTSGDSSITSIDYNSVDHRTLFAGHIPSYVIDGLNIIAK